MEFLAGLIVGGLLVALYFVVGIKWLKSNQAQPVTLGSTPGDGLDFDAALAVESGPVPWVHGEIPESDTVGPQAIANAVTTDFVCTLTDWGPDFVGEDNILPRWRWVLTQRDGVHEMLGNANTEVEAIEEAQAHMNKWHRSASWKVVGPNGISYPDRIYIPFDS